MQSCVLTQALVDKVDVVYKLRQVLSPALPKVQRGATAAEYAIMVSLIAMVIIAAVTAVGIATDGLFQSAADKMP
jgi:pilus assembly protein Flp/PilA